MIGGSGWVTEISLRIPVGWAGDKSTFWLEFWIFPYWCLKTFWERKAIRHFIWDGARLGNNRNSANFLQSRKVRWLFPSLCLTPVPANQTAHGGWSMASIPLNFNRWGWLGSPTFSSGRVSLPRELLRGDGFNSLRGIELSSEGNLQTCPPHSPSCLTTWNCQGNTKFYAGKKNTHKPKKQQTYR